MLVYEEIKKKCDRLGITVSELCRRANVTRPTLENWKKKDPKSIEHYKQLMLVIEEFDKELETEKNQSKCRKQ